MSLTTSDADIYVLGTVVELEADLTNLAGSDVDATGLQWWVRDPAGVEADLAESASHPSRGHYALDIETDAVGVWYWRIVTGGTVVAANGSFVVVDDYAVVGDPTKPTDLRVLVPRARRYCEGPYGPPEGRPRLSDDVLYPMVADACADIIMLSGGLFGHDLLVTARDTRVGFPTAWATDKVLDEWESSLITMQVALNFIFFYLRELKTTVNIANEGTTYEYTLSVNVIRDYIKNLQGARDNALTQLMAVHPTLDRYASNIRVRDYATVGVLEYWDRNIIDQGPMGLGGGQDAIVIPFGEGWR